MATDRMPPMVSSHRLGATGQFWFSSLKSASKGTASFANDWQWLFGTPLIVGLVVGVGNDLPESHPSVTTGRAWLDGLIAAVAAFAVTWTVAFLSGLPKVIAQRYLAERQRADAAEKMLLPQIRCTFNSDDPGCVRTGIISTSSGGRIEADYYRVKVEATGERPVSGCRGRLLAISLDGKPVAEGESLVLPFAPSEDPDATQKALHPRVPEYLDFMVVTEGDALLLPLAGHRGPSSIDFGAIFQNQGEYKFQIVVTNNEGASAAIETSFTWEGARNTVSARQVDHSA